MRTVDTSKWKPFRVGDLFEVLLAKGDIQSKQCEDGDTLLVSAGNEDNGVAARISVEGDGVSELFSARCITVSMFGRAFWQNEPFYAVSHGRVNILQPKQAVSDMTGLFLAAILNAAIGDDFNYQTMCTRARLIDVLVMLPATPDGEPDWAYMESYMRDVMDREEIFAEHLASLTAEAVADGHVVDTSGWRDFVFRDVFAGPYIAHAYHAIELNLEDEPCEDYYEYVSRSCVDNAVQGYVPKCDGRYVAQPRGSICFGAETAYFTYHDVEYLTGNKMYWFLFDVTDSYVEYAQLNNATVNARAIGLFLCAVLNAQLHDKFSYSNGLTGSRCGEQVIMLPATTDGDPDWAYMEQYMKHVMAVESAFAEEFDRLIA